jgi:GNAT superfamily N-acetyltransferase
VADHHRLQAYLRASAAAGREVVELPGFSAYLDPVDSLRYLNYAVPHNDARPRTEAIEELRGAFRSRGRLPRLEWVEETAPAVAAALASAGMTEELRTPLMACAPPDLIDAGAEVDGLEVRPAGGGDLRAVSDLQRTAFGQPALGPRDEPGDPRARGGGAVLAAVHGEVVSAAVWTPVIEGVAEVGGVATARAWRRRGLAGVVTAAATRAAFSAGASLCVISPGDEAALGVYTRAGFERVATMLHWSDPDGGFGLYRG